MKRIPIFSTITVLLAVGLMIGLGVWQIQRLHWKEALLARYAANEHKSPIPFPQGPDQSTLFRPAYATCAKADNFRLEGAGNAGFRMLADCRRARGGAMTVQLGTSHDPQAKTHWPGGTVEGFISHAPTHRFLIETMLHPQPQPLLLVVRTPPPGLNANPGPDLSSVPNNHLSYAVQWFLFATIALVIYALALRRRWRMPDGPKRS
ncbi:SURF1 family protein [Stakelama sediminis]|uniref:SURF1-like protein n=1 Tax=Stakelama sediminis TaxID=463200 RepID=A0A840YW24_9SPHN|nr:SURF1 family protein [Stakelama sediminis]MBB5717762.1 surfeit locus 1 family protein [Stakelama sediminis]